MNRISRLLPVAALLVSGAAAQCFTVTTAPWGSNGQKGAMFDVVNISANPIDVFGFDQVFFAAGTATMEIYTKVGTWNGSENTAGAWTLVGTVAGVAHGAIANGALPIPLPFAVNVPAGATQGFYVTATNATASNVAYTTGVNQLGAIIGSDGTIEVRGGVGKSYPFGSTFGLPTAGRLFMGRVLYSTAGPAACVRAASSAYGTGCVQTADTCFYEHFVGAATFDLSNSAMALVHTGSGYLATPSAATVVPPSGAATVLALTDDSETTVALSAAMPVGKTGLTNALTICSNGYVSVASGNGTGFTPTVATMLNAARTGWWCWHDYNPAIVGSGSVKFEEVAGTAYVTWDGVWDFGGTTAASANTFQLQFDLATGSVNYVWGAMSLLGNDHLVGFSEGGASVDPGTTDISAALPATFNAATFANQPLALGVTGAPIASSSITFDTTNIPSSAPFGAILLGLLQFNPGIDLTAIGMPGCFQYTDNAVVLLFLPLGASSNSLPFSVPNALGFTLHSQSVVLAPAAGLTPLGAIASNGQSLTIGNF